jgi:hypothetical protein
LQTFSKKCLDKCIVICLWNIKEDNKNREIYTTVWKKKKIANGVSIRGKNYYFFASTGRQGNSQFLYYIYGLARTHSAGLAQCQIIRKPNKNKICILYILTWLNILLCSNAFKRVSLFPLYIAIIKHFCSRVGEITQI